MTIGWREGVILGGVEHFCVFVLFSRTLLVKRKRFLLQSSMQHCDFHDNTNEMIRFLIDFYISQLSFKK